MTRGDFLNSTPFILNPDTTGIRFVYLNGYVYQDGLNIEPHYGIIVTWVLSYAFATAYPLTKQVSGLIHYEDCTAVPDEVDLINF